MLQSTASQLVLSQHDVLVIILGYFGRADLARFLRVSSHFFFVAAPQVWCRVPRVKHLIDLVIGPNTEISSLLKIDQQKLDVAKKRPSNLHLHMSRFLLYAPWVKALDLRFSPDGTLSTQWVLLSFLVQSHRPLLPHLRELAMNNWSYSQAEWSIATACIKGLLCSSLVRIRLFKGLSDALWFEPSVALDILDNARGYARDLEVLHILAKASVTSPSVPSASFSILAQFDQLRSLKCSNCMIDSTVLRLLSSCPLLESLDIYGPSFNLDDPDMPDLIATNNMRLEGLTLPAGSFTRLQHLGLHLLLHSVITHLWNFPALVRQLISVDLLFLPQPDTAVTDTVVDHICANSPGLQELSLDQYEDDTEEISLAFIDSMRSLALRRLRMEEMIVYQFSHDNFERLLSRLADVEILELPRMHIEFEHLILIAKYLPWLRRLYVTIYMSEWPANLTPSSVTPSPSILLLGSRFPFEDEFEVEEYYEDDVVAQYVDEMARNLHILWPKGIHFIREDPFHEPRSEVDTKYLALLNRRIEALHDPVGFQTLSTEDYAAMWRFPRWYGNNH